MEAIFRSVYNAATWTLPQLNDQIEVRAGDTKHCDSLMEGCSQWNCKKTEWISALSVQFKMIIGYVQKYASQNQSPKTFSVVNL